MAQNVNGTANCDRCGIFLPGFGVIYGMVCTDLARNGSVTQRIYCYVNNCRAIVLANLVNFSTATAVQPRCSECGVLLQQRSVEQAMLTSDIDPSDGSTMRQLAFCYINGSREKLLAKGVL